MHEALQVFFFHTLRNRVISRFSFSLGTTGFSFNVFSKEYVANETDIMILILFSLMNVLQRKFYDELKYWSGVINGDIHFEI